MIEPTIGRVVWYHPKPGSGDPPPLYPEQPYVALIAAITPEGLLNLTVSNHAGYAFAKQGVRLRQDSDPVERGDAEWMPFQKGQAARHDKPAFDAEGSVKELHEQLEAIKESLEGAHERLEVQVGLPGAPPNDTGLQSIEFRLSAVELWAEAMSKTLPPDELAKLEATITEIFTARQAMNQAPAE